MNKKDIATKKRGSYEPHILFYLLFNLHHAPFTIVIIQTVYPRRATETDQFHCPCLPLVLGEDSSVVISSEERWYYPVQS